MHPTSFPRFSLFSLLPLSALFSLLCHPALVQAEVPEYSVEVIAPLESTNFVRGASGYGHVVGSIIIDGVQRAFVAHPATGLVLLPLPDGQISSDAFDVNRDGVVVGTVSSTGFPDDVGEPAVWTPNGSGGYGAEIPLQFATLPSPLGGDASINGGQIVAIDNQGTMVGWSRFFGFQGGPSTLFSMDQPPIDLRELGFDATVRDMSDTGIVVGGSLRLDLGTGVVTDLGIPSAPDDPAIQFVIAFSVNDSGQTVVAADIASVPTENWLTYIHDDGAGYRRLNSDQLPSRFVGFYDNNNRGDVVASGGLWFADEQQLVVSLASLLTAEDAHWSPSLGFIADNRDIYTSAYDPLTDTTAIVRLVAIGEMLFETGFE